MCIKERSDVYWMKSGHYNSCICDQYPASNIYAGLEFNWC